ncbi:MAG: hypothetical protein ABEJ05_08640 [Haloglomus sp.]
MVADSASSGISVQVPYSTARGETHPGRCGSRRCHLPRECRGAVLGRVTHRGGDRLLPDQTAVVGQKSNYDSPLTATTPITFVNPLDAIRSVTATVGK